MSKRDKFVIESFNKGDLRAYKVIFNKYYQSLVDFALRITADEPVAREIVMDLLLKLWDLRDNFDTESNIKSFLYTSVRNRCIDHLRHQHVIRKAEKEIAALSEWSVDDSSFTLFAETDLIDQLREEVDKLPTNFSKVITRYYFEMDTQQELANHFGVNERTIRNWLESAKEMLRERLLKQKKYALLLFFSLLDYLQ